MPIIKLPATGKGNQSGTIRRWLKKPGETVRAGDLLAQVETDAGLMEIESPLAGRLTEVLVAEAKTVAAKSPMAVIESDGAPASSAPTPAAPALAKPSSGGKVIPILMPKAGQSMEEGTINRWHVQVGAMVKKGDVIFEVETDKANMDVESPDSGRLARIVLPEGGNSVVLVPVAYLADNDADVDAFIASEGGATATVAPAAAKSVEAPATPKRESAVSSAAVSDAGRVKASPAARRIAQERGVDLGSVATGTGPGGRILSTDLPTSALAATGGSRKRMSQMRKAIARNLVLSKQTIPHFYVRLTVDAAPSLAYYQSRKAQFPCSINDVIVAGCAKAIKEFPAFRSKIEGDEFVESASANIGIAVGMDDGLVVPVLMGAERLSFQQIAGETKRLATSARSGKIEGMGMGSFTITNLGMFGTEEFSAIINPPEAAILAVGSARESVIAKDGALRVGKVMTMTLSSDHRIIDGMLAAKFLARLKEFLENPDANLK